MRGPAVDEILEEHAMTTCNIDPTFRVILVRGYDRCDYTISASPALDAWSFWVDRDGSQESGVVTGAEHVLRLKARLESEIAHLKTLGWMEPATEEWT